MAKVAQRQVLATVAPSSEPTNASQIFPNLPKWTNFRFAQVSGGEITASVEKLYEGGQRRPTVLCAPAEIGDITLTAHFDDNAEYVGQAYYDITVSIYNCDLRDPSNDRVYPKALLVGLTEPEGDSSSGAPSTFALTFSIQSLAGDD
jgi:hypothetical protein